MKDKTKYILIGVAIGIIIGLILFYLLMTFRVIRPFGFPGNLSNFSGNFSRRFNRSETP